MRAIAAIITVLVLASATFASAEEKTEQKWELPSQGLSSLVVKIVVGSLRIETDRKSGIVVRAVRTVRATNKALAQSTLKDKDLRVDYTSPDGILTFDDHIPETLTRERFTEDAPEVELDIEIHLPVGMKVSSTLAVGATHISGELDGLSVKSGYGGVKLENIRVKGGTLVSIETGDLEISGVVNDLQAATKVGVLHAALEASAANRVSLQTQIGSIESQFRSLPKFDLSVAASVGSVQLKVPGNFKGDATVSVQTGKPSSTFNLTRRPRSVGDTGGLLTGSVGKGAGLTLKLSTGVGDATLERG